LASAGFKEKADSTQALYRRILDKLSRDNGANPVRLLKRRHIRKMRDALSDTPGAANNVLRLLKILLNFAVEEEVIEANPAARMRELKGGEYRSWTDEECAAFEKRWLPGSMERRAYAIGLYTGQRRADQVAMTRAHRKDGVIQVLQAETGESLWVAEHSALAAELALGPQNHMSLLTTSKGKAFDAVYYGAWFADAIYEAKLPDDCVLHELRKCAARHLAEAGCSEVEIMSITGHRTSRMVAHYTKDASKKRQTTAAIIKLTGRAK
jgi:integrase